MKLKYILIVFVITISIMLINVFITIRLKKTHELQIVEYETQLFQKVDLLKKLDRSLKLKYLSEQQPIDTAIKLKTIDGSEKRLKDIILKKTLFFRIFEENCLECIRPIIKKIKEEKFEHFNIVVCTNYSTREVYNMKVFQTNEIPNCEIYNIPDLKVTVDSLHQPYLFLVDKNLKINNLYIHYKEFSDNFELYYKSLN